MYPSPQQNVVRFRAVLIFSGLFNILLAAPLMIPGIFEQYLGLFWSMNEALGLGGHEPAVSAAGVYALLVNTAGIDLVLIGSIVLWSSRDPVSFWFVPALNAVGRTIFAGVIVYYVIAFDIPRIVLLIGGIDLGISALFVWYLLALRKA